MESPDDSDDIVRELLAASESDPSNALEWISRLGSEALSEPVILFARYNALRHLAGDRLAAAGFKSISLGAAQEIRKYFGQAEEAHARAALSTIADLEMIRPDYVKSRDFLQVQVDQLAILLDLFDPGASQRILGWTKMARFLSGIRFVGDLKSQVPPGLLQAALQRRFSVDEIVTAGLGAFTSTDPTRGRFIEVWLLDRLPVGQEVVGDVHAGTLRYFANDEAEYTAKS
jgi:hypothetical protein